MKKHILIVTITAIFVSCGSNQMDSYPEIISSFNKEGQYDIAKAEWYKINSFYNCECDLEIRLETSGTETADTISFWETEITLDTMYLNGDTVSYLFKPELVQKNAQAFVLPGSNFYVCQNYYGIDFLKDSETPLGYKIAESGYLERNSSLASIDSVFYQCLGNHKKQINSWLRHYLENIGYKI